jgi:diacylglycerol kinase family enzyme
MAAQEWVPQPSPYNPSPRRASRTGHVKESTQAIRGHSEIKSTPSGKGSVPFLGTPVLLLHARPHCWLGLAVPSAYPQANNMAASATSGHRLRTRDPVLIVANGNPLSRRAGSMAQTALRQLQMSSDSRVELVTTEYAGHAREVAETWACEHLDGTIVGIGGDGTLNEIGSGILAATAARGSQVVLVVCSGGNANDQYRSWARTQRIRLDGVLSADPVSVDVLEVAYSAANDQQATRRHALSYAAIGALATGASVVNGRPRGMRANLALIPQTLLRAQPVSVVIGGEPARVDSLSWHIVSTMAKVFRASSNSRRADGQMEIVLIPHRRWPSALRMSWFGLRALVWPPRHPQSERMTFYWDEGGAAQLDGETLDIPPGSDVTVHCLPAAIRMLCCEIDDPSNKPSSKAPTPDHAPLDSRAPVSRDRRY